MEIITPAQCRAARAVLNWSQPDLSKRCAVHVQTISSFEHERATPTKRTLQRITQTLENAGIEFLEGNGVRESAMRYRIYSGNDEFRLFYDDIYNTARNQGGEICLFNGVPKKIVAHLGKEWYAAHAQRMTAIRANFSFKVLIEEGDKNLIAASFAEYRWVPKNKFNDKTVYIYGDKVALFNFDKNAVRVLMIQQPEFADSERILFNLSWEHLAKKIPHNV